MDRIYATSKFLAVLAVSVVCLAIEAQPIGSASFYVSGKQAQLDTRNIDWRPMTHAATRVGAEQGVRCVYGIAM